MTVTYKQLIELAVPTRQAATLLGLSRTTIYRKPVPPSTLAAAAPPNKLSAMERAEILTVLNSPEFVDLAPQQIYTKLLDQGIYLGSPSTFYRVLEENKQVKERRALVDMFVSSSGVTQPRPAACSDPRRQDDDRTC